MQASISRIMSSSEWSLPARERKVYYVSVVAGKVVEKVLEPEPIPT
jgi:hypothetical protein